MGNRFQLYEQAEGPSRRSKGRPWAAGRGHMVRPGRHEVARNEGARGYTETGPRPLHISYHRTHRL